MSKTWQTTLCVILASVAYAAADVPSDYRNVVHACRPDINQLCPNATTPTDWANCFSNNIQCISANCSMAVTNAYHNTAPSGSAPTQIPINPNCQSAFLDNCGSFTVFADQLNCWKNVNPDTLPLACVNAAKQAVVTVNYQPCRNDFTNNHCHGNSTSQLVCLIEAFNKNGAGAFQNPDCARTLLGAIGNATLSCAQDTMHRCSGTPAQIFLCLMKQVKEGNLSPSCKAVIGRFIPPTPPAIIPPNYQDPLQACGMSGVGGVVPTAPSQQCINLIIQPGSICTLADVRVCIADATANSTAAGLLRCMIRNGPRLSGMCVTAIQKIINWFPVIAVPPTNNQPPALNFQSLCSLADVRDGAQFPCFPPGEQRVINATSFPCWLNNAKLLNQGLCQRFLTQIAQIPFDVCSQDVYNFRCGNPQNVPIANVLNCLKNRLENLSPQCKAAISVVLPPPPSTRRHLGPAGDMLGACAAESAAVCSDIYGIRNAICLLNNVNGSFSDGCVNAIHDGMSRLQIPSDVQLQCTMELNAIVINNGTLDNPACASATGLRLLLCVANNQAALQVGGGGGSQTSCLSSIQAFYQSLEQGGDAQSACGTIFSTLCPHLRGPALLTCVTSKFNLLALPCQKALRVLAGQSPNSNTVPVLPTPPPNSQCTVLDPVTATGGSSLVINSDVANVVASAVVSVGPDGTATNAPPATQSTASPTKSGGVSPGGRVEATLMLNFIVFAAIWKVMA